MKLLKLQGKEFETSFWSQLWLQHEAQHWVREHQMLWANWPRSCFQSHLQAGPACQSVHQDDL